MFDKFSDNVANGLNKKLTDLHSFYHTNEKTKGVVQIIGLGALAFILFILGTVIHGIFWFGFAGAMGYLGFITIKEHNRQMKVRGQEIKDKYAAMKLDMEEKQKKRFAASQASCIENQKRYDENKKKIDVNETFSDLFKDVNKNMDKTFKNMNDTLNGTFKQFDKSMKKMDKDLDDLFDDDDMGV